MLRHAISKSQVTRQLLNQQSRSFALVKRFTESHEWIELDTDTGTAKIGITDHAQAELGDIVHIDVPDVGTEFV